MRAGCVSRSGSKTFTAETRSRGEGKKTAEETGRQKGAVEASVQKQGTGGETIKPMAVSVRIPSYLASFAAGKSSFDLEGTPATVSDALQSLWQLHPGLQARILDEQGEVRQHINIFVGEEAIRFADGLSTKVPNDAEILIVPAVSGG
jgi:molybdopterin synthase sulfur carrier subunit